MPLLFALTLIGLATLAPLPERAEAGAVGVTISGGHRHLNQFQGHHGQRQFQSPRPFRGQGFHGHGFHGFGVIVVPQPVYVVPSRCWRPGSYTYYWVPQVQAYYAWIPGQWLADGAWMEGRYETRYYNSGYYQPYWVEGFWAAC